MLRHHLANVPFYITSATIPRSMISDIKDKLFIKNCQLFQRTNDRPNIHLMVRKMQHPQNTYHDLAFLIPKSWTPDQPLPWKFMVFFNSKKEAEDAALYLMNLVPLEVREKFLWFHAGMSGFFRVEQIESFRNGETWGLELTDAGGMVCGPVSPKITS